MKVLIANRGAIACRIIATLKRMEIPSVAVYSEADFASRHVSLADEAVLIGPAPAAQSYLDPVRILSAAVQSGATAIHPGYGFLSENADFAEACEAAGIVFIGPAPETIRLFGLKHSARATAQALGLPLLQGTGLLADAEAAHAAAEAVGYPVMLKATAGGGGIGMRVCTAPDQLADVFAEVARLGRASFADGGVFLETFVARARHIEVQLFGDGCGRVVSLGERDCSLQRRHQKVVEETPAPGLSDESRARIVADAVRLGEHARYRSAGTVEFLYDADLDRHYFLEVNTRLQVEHGVTEAVTGIDLVAWMVRGAQGDFSMLDRPPPAPTGAAIQVRLYSEDPGQYFRPSSGLLTEVAFPSDVRVDGWVGAGTEVSSHYDPLLAKMIVHAPDRPAAVARMQAALDDSRLAGIETNLTWLRQVVREPAFTSGEVTTAALAEVCYRPRAIRVLAGGTETTVQDLPGRVGYWAVGVPPSGPMDPLGFRLANRFVGNPADAAGLEITVSGPTLCFTSDALVALAGARLDARLDGETVPHGAAFEVRAGQTLKLGRIVGAGVRAALAVRGGFDVPMYLGSRATFTLGRFGGHGGRALAAGDTLHLLAEPDTSPPQSASGDVLPRIGNDWAVRVRIGPHEAPDFFSDSDMAMLAETQWRVHHNSNRTGVRLIGPSPEWARRDGGEAGLHPSNIHDNAYAVGAVDFTGDMPILLGPDGPSLGGFVCPLVTIDADLWKLGQLAPGDRVRFAVVQADEADRARAAQELLIAALAAPETSDVPPAVRLNAERGVLRLRGATDRRPAVTYRRQGDSNILVEYGPITLDLELRIRVHALMQAIEALALPGLIDITPGIRSLQLHHDPRVLPHATLLAILEEAEAAIGSLDDFSVPSRIVHLPLSWNDPAIHQTIARYMEVVRDDAPWCPDNIEFIRRVNGLADADAVREIVFAADYLVLGLGDVYLGAPVAVPIDPRHRLVTTKYNPARTWTPPNVVGIGGAYMCIYGMEGPGGYQLFGRTLQVWNSFGKDAPFAGDTRWSLRFFDRIRFFPVSHEELSAWRADFPLGRRGITIQEGKFRLADYRQFLEANAGPIAVFRQRREAAFAEERAAWERAGEFDRVAALGDTALLASEPEAIQLQDGESLVEAAFAGAVARILVQPGQAVQPGEALLVLEAMKTETSIPSPEFGIVRAVHVAARQSVLPGSPLVTLGPP